MLTKWFSRTIGFPLIVNGGWRRDKDRRGLGALVAEKAASQYWPAEQMEAWQLRRLQSLLTHAGQHVPYYRDLFRATGFDPRGVRALADLEALPRLTRAIVQSQGRRMLADDAAARGLAPGHTSGTSDVPLDFWHDRAFGRHLEAAAWMSDRVAGRRFGAPTAYLWGWTPVTRARERLLNHLRNLLRNEQRLNTREMSDATLLRCHAALQAARPDLLVAYPSGAVRLARCLEQHGLRPSYPRRALIPTGEVLEPETRAALKRAFPAPIFNRYGSREAGLIAFECEQHAGLHLNTANLIVECAGPDPYHAPAEIIITQLHNQAMPLIRYQVDDLAVLATGNCACGRTSPRLARIAGRKMLHFITPAGTPVESYFLIKCILQMPNVIEFQLIQHSCHHLRLLVVPGAGCVPEQFADARTAILKIMGAECELTLEFVESIPRPASGKLQRLVVEMAEEKEADPKGLKDL